MRNIKVVAAVIVAKNEAGEKSVFATKRGYGDYAGGWEFPGGKIEAGESGQDALAREIREELDTEVKVGEHIGTIEYDYPTFHISMACYVCEVIRGDLVLKEHKDAKWLTRDTLSSVDWLPADVLIMDKVRELLI